MRIALADDHALFRAGLHSALAEAFGDSTEVLEAGDFAALAAVIERQADLDLVLCDLRMPGMDPQGGVRALAELCGEATPLVMVSASEDPADACRSIRQGARGYILKSDSLAVLQRALELVLAGGIYAPAAALMAAQDPAVDGPGAPVDTTPLPPLSSRQMMIFERLADGKPNKLIARELGIAEGTVKAQLRAVFRKLGVNNRTQAALFAARLLGREAAAPGAPDAPDDVATTTAGAGGGLRESPPRPDSAKAAGRRRLKVINFRS
ncbi:MAG: response regulator transcription factor [Kiloniellaceae bacterium]